MPEWDATAITTTMLHLCSAPCKALRFAPPAHPRGLRALTAPAQMTGELIEEAGHGRLSADEQGPKRLSDATDAYLAAKRIRCSPHTIELEEERLSIVKKHFGDVPLSAITATTIADFQRARHNAGIANRTINMDVGVLSRVLKSCGR